MNMTDKEFSDMLKRDLPQAPRSEWFTRKVINRLPRRTPPPVERWTYALALMAVLGYVAWSVCQVDATGEFTVGMFSGIVCAVAIVFAIVWSIISAKLAQADSIGQNP